jgi:hypothetical protein
MRTALNVGVGMTALLLAFMGACWMFAPEAIAAQHGVKLDGVPALSLARADLGGFFLGSALLCALGLRPGHSQLLTAAAVLLGAVAVGRTIGLVADDFDLALAGAVGIEIVMVALLAVAARHGVPASAAG